LGAGIRSFGCLFGAEIDKDCTYRNVEAFKRLNVEAFVRPLYIYLEENSNCFALDRFFGEKYDTFLKKTSIDFSHLLFIKFIFIYLLYIMENKDLSISQLTDKYKENKDEILRLNAKLIHSYKTAIANVKIVLDVKHCDSFSRHLDHTSRQIIENLQLSEDYTNLKKMTQSLAILETELKSKGKALFENLNFDNFDLSTLPEIEKLFNKEKTDDMPVEKNFRRAALELQNITRETPVKSLVGNLGLQATNSLVSDGSIKTY